MTARDPIDALAEVLRIWQHVSHRPLWSGMDDEAKEEWWERACFIRDALGRRDIALVPAPAASGGTKA